MGTIIYGLTDPRTDHLRYIGKTKGTLHVRKLGHLNDVKRGSFYIPRHRWISDLLSNGLEPEIFEIETVEDWREAEQFWIGYFKSIGCDLLNATAGGDGLCAYRHSPDTRKKQAAAALARYSIPGERQRTGRAVTAAFQRPEVRQNLRDGRKKVPRRSLQICIDALIRSAKSPEGRAARSARRRGFVASAETLAKMSLAATGRKWTAERREAQRQRRLGTRHSPETKARMSIAGLARFARAKSDA